MLAQLSLYLASCVGDVRLGSFLCRGCLCTSPSCVVPSARIIASGYREVVRGRRYVISSAILWFAVYPSRSVGILLLVFPAPMPSDWELM